MENKNSPEYIAEQVKDASEMVGEMKRIQEAVIESLGKITKGRRVRLIHSSDYYTGLAPGAEGTVVLVDSLGTLHVSWDDGSTLGLVPGADRWEFIS